MSNLSTDKKENSKISSQERLAKLYDSIGYVYVIHDKDLCRVKIGTTKRPYSRPKAVAMSSGVRNYSIWVSKQTLDAKCVERQAHKHFHNHHLCGEWFGCSFNDATKYIAHNVKPFTKEEYLKMANAREESKKDFLYTMQKFMTNIPNGNFQMSEEKPNTLSGVKEIQQNSKTFQGFDWLSNILGVTFVTMDGEYICGPSKKNTPRRRNV